MRERILVTGIVQGVGFRPFVYRLARELSLGGFVRNDGQGVVIEVEGRAEELEGFRRRLCAEAPPLASIARMKVHARPESGQRDFSIHDSGAAPDAHAAIPPDTALCADCRRELFDPADRRHLYPFLNCTNCGPRYSIATRSPYDRPATTMAAFAMCPDCESEYRNPSSRRFHAQPNACPVCGPRLELLAGESSWTRREAMEQTRRLLQEGAIVAIKSIGGFQLACDAGNDAAVRRLRERKRRPSKPFALMLADPDAVRRIALVGDRELELLTSPEAPIVLLPARPGSPIAPSVAPGRRELGCMLPYSPLHMVLFDSPAGEAALFPALVMTSGNRSEEPIARDNSEARHRLAGIADAFLLHDRDIAARLDDSVAAPTPDGPILIRRARGYTPRPLTLSRGGPAVLAVGAHWKNTICYLQGWQAWVSQHIGNLDTLEAMRMFDETRAHLESFFHLKPEVIAHDLHPGYRTTQWALEQTGVKRVPVQHHHAHIAACAAEHRVADPVVGLAMDGTGFGPGGAIWGGEFLVCEGAGFARLGHFREVPLPGGEAAIREPWRMAVSWLLDADLDPAEFLPGPLTQAVSRLCASQLQPRTSSAGRFFDAVAALTGICRMATYEGEPAAMLEAAAWPDGAPYPFDLFSGPPLQLDFRGTIRAIAHDLAQKTPAGHIAARTHATLASALTTAAGRIAAQTGIGTVLLSGGCFQNRRLLHDCGAALMQKGLRVLWPRQFPPNDAGISLGQAVIARAVLAS